MYSLVFLNFGPNFTLCLSHIPPKCELNHSMITTAKAAPSPDVTSQFICTSEQKVQYYNPPGKVFYSLTQEFILNALPEPRGLPTAWPATFPVDVSGGSPPAGQALEIMTPSVAGGRMPHQQALLDLMVCRRH